MKLVVIESPFKGDGTRSLAENAVYARACLTDSLYRGEFPLASHLLYPQVLDDTVPDQREMGIQAGLAWADRAELGAFYLDYGESEGMMRAREFYQQKGIPTVDRLIILEKKMVLQMPMERCRHCHGAGRVAGCGECARCHGTGYCRADQQCTGGCCR